MTRQTVWVDISEITSTYLPISKKKARKLVLTYLNCKRIGNRIYVKREDLDALLNNSDIIDLPLA